MNFRRARVRSRKNSLNYMVNTERWRLFNRKLSRPDDFIEDDSEEEEHTITEVKDWVEEFFGRKSINESNSDQDIEVKLTRKQTLILSTLVPDEILLSEKFEPTETSHFVGVLLMADVSGYTALSERYNNTGKGGTYRLTVTLNTYLGSLIELIYSHGGDVLKFAGDAFLALWKTDKRTFLCHTIHAAIACALVIQHSFSSYETDVKVNLRVKLAISAGNLIFSSIGTGIDMNFVIYGLPVIEAKLAESLCASGEVKIAPTAWGHCYSRNYDHIINDDGHVTVRAILYDPRDKDVNKPFNGISTLIKPIKKPFNAVENLPDHIWDTSKSVNVVETLRKCESLSLRRAIVLAEEKHIGSEIRKFMIRPVLTQIDAHQPLEYLTEMRLVSILFITLKPKQCQYLQLITIVNNAYQITCEIVYKSMGCVNKIILFDKDVMMLVIFGLRGFKHESEAQAALKCAYSIKKSVSALDGVHEVSIGVTTGQVYCGVVGHPLRREFTVIGAIVNKAARLMCFFGNKITCDEATFIKSKMSTNGFTLQPKTELKGILHPGKIYEYSEEIRVKELYDIQMVPPILNRSDEMEYFKNWLDDSHLSYRDFDALLLIGESRIGKSRLLEWMARYASNKYHHICRLNLTSIHSATPYLALSQIMNQILGLKEPIVGFAKEEKIVQLLQVYNEDLCYLNNIIKVRFAYHEGIYKQNEQKRKEMAKNVFEKLIMSVVDTHVIFLDDLQNLDSNSWEFISTFLKRSNFFTVMTVTRSKFSSVHSWLYSVFIDNNIRKIVLGSLGLTSIAPLACQILDVDAVSNDLCDALWKKCKGMPGLIESIILHLFSTGAIEIKKINKSELAEWKNEDLQFPNPTLLHPQALNAKDQANLDQLIQNDYTGELGICIVTKKEELNTNINVQNIDALIMIQIDSLTPYQQLLLKIASVIGNIVPRELLENIMFENNMLTTARAIKRLFSLRILACANVKNKWHSKASLNASTHRYLLCCCSFDYDPEISDNLPKYAFCKVLKFRNKSSRRTCYELLPINQKKEFHSRIVYYLENNKQKCVSCGGTIVVVQSVSNLGPEGKISIESNVTTVHDYSDNEPDKTSDNEREFKNQNLETVNKKLSNNAKDSKSENLDNFNIDKTSKVSYGSLPSFSSNKSHSQLISRKLKNKEDDKVLSRQSTKRVTMPSLVFKNHSFNSTYNPILCDKLRAVTEADKISDWHKLGIIDSNDILHPDPKTTKRKSFGIKIEKGVSQIDLSKCTCAELNVVTYEQLIYHADKADMKTKTIDFLIKCAHLNYLINSIENAISKLEEAEKHLEKLSGEYICPFDRQMFLGKIYSLKAAVNLASDNLPTTKIHIEHAMRIYNINPNKVFDFFNITSILASIQVNRNRYRLREAIKKSDSVFCLNIASLLYSAIGMEKISRSCALRAVALVQKVQCSVVDMCDAFSNALQVEISCGNPEYTAAIENIANDALKRLEKPIYADELYAFGRFCLATFRSRVSRAHLAPSIRSGFRAFVISRFVNASCVSLEIIPDLFYILISRRRINEAVDILKETLQLGQNRVSYECETWYYALCIDMILDAGFQLESPYEITRFAEFAIYRNKLTGASRRRLAVGLWSYWLRVDSERRAKRFEAEALSWSAHDDDGSMTTLISAMRLAEGMLESLARKMDDLKKVVDLMALRSLADRELIRLETDARICRTVYPRWMLLKANSLNLSGRNVTAAAMFNQVPQLAHQKPSKQNISVFLQKLEIGRISPK